MSSKMRLGDRPTLRATTFALLLAPAMSLAQPGMMSEQGMGYSYGPGWGMGPGGMMMGPGGGMMGPGMMGGMGSGTGTMGGMGMTGGGGMMGPGMMMGPGGMGMGSGMMGGMGMMGPGMTGGMGMSPIAMLDLTDEQRKQIAKIQGEVRKQHWGTQGKILEEQARLSELYATERPDAKQIGQAYGNMAKLQQEILEANIQAHNRMLDVLTPEQRDQLSQWRRGMARGYMGHPGSRGGPGRGMGPGKMHRGRPPAGGSSDSGSQ